LKLGGKIYNVPNFRRHPLKYYRELSRIIKEGKYEIVHINMMSAANIIPHIVAKRCNVRHIISHSHSSNTPKGIIRKILDKLNKRILINNTTDFFGCSYVAANWLFDNKIKKEKIVIVNNAIDLKKFKKDDKIRKKIREELKINDGLVIGHVGRFCAEKNHTFLVDVFKELLSVKPDSYLLLIGSGELLNNIKNKVSELGIEKNVIFLGNVNNVNEYMQAMDMFILPSYFEGLPLVAIEAQASGLKCIISSNVTKDVNINNNCKFLNIKESPKTWVDFVIDFDGKEYISDSKRMLAYDISYSSKLLEKTYFVMSKK
jgi:glycosyltransferase involved in cell wall biosynthesis